MNNIVVKTGNGHVTNVYTGILDDCQAEVVDAMDSEKCNRVERMVSRGVLHDVLNPVRMDANEDIPYFEPAAFLLIHDEERIKTKTGQLLQRLDVAYTDGFLTACGLYAKLIRNLFIERNPVASTVYKALEPLNQVLDDKYSALCLRINREDYDHLWMESKESFVAIQENGERISMASLNGVSMRNLRKYEGHNAEMWQGDLYIGDKKVAWFSDTDGGEPEFGMEYGYSLRKLEEAIIRVNDEINTFDEFLITLQDLVQNEEEYRSYLIKGFPVLVVQLVGAYSMHYIALRKKYCAWSDEQIMDFVRDTLESNMRDDHGDGYTVKIYRGLTEFVVGAPFPISDIQISRDGGEADGDK